MKTSSRYSNLSKETPTHTPPHRHINLHILPPNLSLPLIQRDNPIPIRHTQPRNPLHPLRIPLWNIQKVMAPITDIHLQLSILQPLVAVAVES